MSDQSPYEQLGVSDESSFEEIQAARDRLVTQYEGDRKQQEQVEAAYDAVLMDRLRMRQEGKIKVPDRIRFPERLVPPPTSATPAAVSKAPGWLQNLRDTPTPADIWLPAGVMSSLSALVLVVVPSPLQLALVAGVGSCFYFLYRKERKLGRSVLLTLLGLCVGIFVGGLLGSLLPAAVLNLGILPESIAVVFTLLMFWLISSFLR